MTLPLLLVIISVLAAASVFFLVRNHSTDDVEVLLEQLQTVDSNAFLNLISSHEQDYLRYHLPAGEFRKVHRERMFAAVEYSWTMAKQARILNRIAEAALIDPDPEVVMAATHLQKNAVRVRVRALQSIPRLALRAVIPSFGTSTDFVAATCDQLTWNVAALARLRRSMPQSPRAA